MTKHWSGVVVLVLALTAYGCGETANGGNLGGSGGDAGSGGMAGMGGGMGGDGGMGGMAGMGGEGGMGGMPDLCMDVDCSDGNECTQDVCDPADGSCSNPNETDGTSCDFSGLPGICAAGVCEDAMLCADVDCSDGNVCTQDLCDTADGTCSNPAEPDDTQCEFSEGVGGVCTAGVCEDAMLCADAATRCDDENQCTEDGCDPADGACTNVAVPDDTVCEFSEGVGGVCTAGVCEDAMLCADAETRCDDSNECTQNLCDPADGTCSNPAEPDETVCEFAEGVGGECIAGVCEDAMLCADAATRCDDSNECTDDSCDPADGACSNVAVPDDTECEFSEGVGGVCTAGVCEDAMLCADAATRCDDKNECTDDSCDPADGVCSNTNLPLGTVCDAAGLPGECDGAGACVATCTPTPGINVTLPTAGTPTATYTDMTNGFSISATTGEVTFRNPSGVGANAFGDQFRIDLNNPPGATGDSLRIEFFDLDGNDRQASNVSILLFANGVGGMVSVTVDGGPALSLPATPGVPLVLPGTGHSFEVTLMNGVPTPYHTWSQLSYDHECL